MTEILRHDFSPELQVIPSAAGFHVTATAEAMPIPEFSGPFDEPRTSEWRAIRWRCTP
jgi:hypothetical protein